MTRQVKVSTPLAVAFVTAGLASAAAVVFYTRGDREYPALLMLAVGFAAANLAIIGELARRGVRRIAGALAVTFVVGEAAAIQSVVQFRRDFEQVLPAPLASKAIAAALPASPGNASAVIPRVPAGSAAEAMALPSPAPATTVTTDVPAADLATTTPLDFPQFLGPDRNGSTTQVRLARDWTAAPPQQLWRQRVGEGWGGFAVVNGYAVTIEQQGSQEIIVCYEVATGRRVWSYAIAARYENPVWPEAGVGPRSTPAIHDGLVYTLGATGRLLCLDGRTGKLMWERDLLKEYGVTSEQESLSVPFGRSNSPLVVDDLVIVPAGGPPGHRVSLVAYERTSGTKRWEAGTRHISQSSPAVMTLAGRRQIVIVNEDTVSGHDVATGSVLWEQAWPGATVGPVNVAQAQLVAPNRIFVSKSYGGGAALYEVSVAADGTFSTLEIWKSNRVMRTRFTNVAIRGDYVYGLSDGILECIQLGTGDRVWKEARLGHGQLVRVDDLLLILAESGEVVIVEASPDSGGREIGRFRAIQGTSWNPPALYGDVVLVRNAKEAAAYRLPLVAGSPAAARPSQ